LVNHHRSQVGVLFRECIAAIKEGSGCVRIDGVYGAKIKITPDEWLE
jgi:hypothetical protein